jgi:hypothetical protein
VKTPRKAAKTLRRKIGASAPKKHRLNERSKANLKPAWQPGQSGNPAGRQKGSRNKLSEQYLATVCAVYDECGDEIVREEIRRDPGAFVKMVMSLIPKKIEVEGNQVTFYAEVPKAASDDEWKRFLLDRAKPR